MPVYHRLNTLFLCFCKTYCYLHYFLLLMWILTLQFSVFLLEKHCIKVPIFFSFISVTYVLSHYTGNTVFTARGNICLRNLHKKTTHPPASALIYVGAVRNHRQGMQTIKSSSGIRDNTPPGFERQIKATKFRS